MRCQVLLRAEGPLLVGKGLAAQNVQLGRDFVPGSAWRGALADAIRRHAGVKAPGAAAGAAGVPADFDAAFGQGARFGFLYPVPAEGWEGFPLPLTVRSCKAKPGFLPEDGDENDPRGGHGIQDVLLAHLRWHAGMAEEEVTRGGCRRCGERLDRHRGLAARRGLPGTDRSAYREVKVRRRLLLRVGLDRRTETAADGVLYALDAAVPGKEETLCFAGTWRGNREQREALRRLLEAACPRAGNGWVVRVGTARARGLGKAVVEIKEAEDPLLPPLERRLDAFQPRLRSGDLAEPKHLYFALTLRAPLLVRDPAGVPCARPDATVLAPYVENLPAGLQFLGGASAIEWEAWDGWAMAWGLPKPVVTAVAPGSVLVYRAPAREKEAVLAFLQEVEERGLGERTAEGWGEAVACDPLHVRFDAGREA